MVTKIDGAIPSFSLAYSFTQSGQAVAGVLLDDKQLTDLHGAFSELTLSDEGQKILESLSVGDLLVQSGGSYTVEFDESGTAGIITFVVDPEMSTSEVDEEKRIVSNRFHDLQDESIIFVGIASDGKNTRDIEIEMKSASSLGIKIGKHHSLKALLDSVLLEEEF